MTEAVLLSSSIWLMEVMLFCGSEVNDILSAPGLFPGTVIEQLVCCVL